MGIKSKTNYVILFNGLGNQIGQLALFLLINEELKQSVKLVNINNRRDQLGLSDVFDTAELPISRNIFIEILFRLAISPKIPSLVKSFLRKNPILSIYEEPKNLSFDLNMIEKMTKSGRVSFVGGWHNINLHDKIINRIKQLLNLKRLCDGIKNSQNNKKFPIIGVHVRGKDYLNEAEIITYGNIATIEYYAKAISYAKSRMPNGKLLFFTDDKEYVEKFFKQFDVKFGTGRDAIQDFSNLMSCDALIIGNSSFAYWAARLNDNAEFVIRPKRFTNFSESNTYPVEWVDLYHE